MELRCYKSGHGTCKDDRACCNKDIMVFLGSILRLSVHYEASKDTFTIRSLLYLQTFETFEASSQPYSVQSCSQLVTAKEFVQAYIY